MQQKEGTEHVEHFECVKEEEKKEKELFVFRL